MDKGELRKLGKGAYGEVYGRDRLAIKYISIEDTQAALHEFIMSRLCDSKYVLPFTGIKYANGFYELHMPRFTDSLNGYIVNIPIMPNYVRCITRDVLEAVKYLHARGIVHCDIKPANVLLRYTPEIHCVLCDFSLACLELETIRDNRINTYVYRAPEVDVRLGTHLISPGWDIWALGATLYELIAARYLIPTHDGGVDPHDSSREICATLKVDPAGEREDRLERLYAMSVADIESALFGSLTDAPLNQIYINSGYLTFISSLLTPNPARRPTITEATAVYVGVDQAMTSRPCERPEETDPTAHRPPILADSGCTGPSRGPSSMAEVKKIELPDYEGVWSVLTGVITSDDDVDKLCPKWLNLAECLLQRLRIAGTNLDCNSSRIKYLILYIAHSAFTIDKYDDFEYFADKHHAAIADILAAI